MEAEHEQLLKVLRDKYWYERGLDTDKHNKPDCSCGCKWLHDLSGIRGMDFGVCFNAKSPRAGLLTFEHMGCDYFRYDKQEIADRKGGYPNRLVKHLKE